MKQKVTPPTPTPGYGGGYHGGVNDPVTLSRVAELLGINADQLKQELTAGKTLAEVAKAKGVSEDAVVTTILAPRKDVLAVLVRYGYLTQEQADQIYQRLAEATKAAINRPGWGSGSGHGGMMGGFGHGSMMGSSSSGYGYGPGGMMQGWAEGSPWRGRTL